MTLWGQADKLGQREPKTVLMAEALALPELLPAPKLVMALVKAFVQERIWGSLSSFAKYVAQASLMFEGMRGSY